MALKALQFEQPIFVSPPKKIDEKTDTICLLKVHATKFTLLQTISDTKSMLQDGDVGLKRRGESTERFY